MFDHHSKDTSRPFRNVALSALAIVLTVIGLAILVSFSWNLFAPEVLGLDRISVKHAIGLVVLAGSAAYIWRLPKRRAQTHSKSGESGHHST